MTNTLKKNRKTRESEVIHSVDIVQMDEPCFLNCYLVILDYKIQKNGSNSSTGEWLQFEDPKILMEFVNKIRTRSENDNLLDILRHFYNEYKNEEFVFCQQALNVIDELENLGNDSEIVIERCHVYGYFDEFGRKREVLINQSFSPLLNMEFYSDTLYLIPSETSDELFKNIPKGSYVLMLNDEDSEDDYPDRDKNLNFTYVFKETETHYHLKFLPHQLSRYGFIPEFKNDYKNFHDSIPVLIDKKTLQLSSIEEPLFNEIKVRNKSFK